MVQSLRTSVFLTGGPSMSHYLSFGYVPKLQLIPSMYVI